jgi:radical SAM superfamily enzyme YgiQ (UPF0313 family)
MRVVFLQRDSFIKLGIEQLSAVLKGNGHECDLFIESGEANFFKSLLNSGADLFAFSCTSGGEKWVLDTVAKIKREKSTPVIIGGPHATFFPQILEAVGVDYICRGEGEGALLDLVEALVNKSIDIKKIPNIWSKNCNGAIYKNDVRPFVEDLDELPPLDFSIYSKYKYMIPYNLDMFPVITGRGCPYNCSYCFNNTYKNLYWKKGKYLRRRSPANLIQELVQAKMQHGIRKINFVDDSFFLFPTWINEFSGMYKEKVKLPFIVNVEATQVKDNLVRMIKDMGCICVRMGVETGNESLRKKVLNKNLSNQQIIKAAGVIKQYGIKLTTYNMLGLPSETIGNALETFKLNKEIGSDFAWCSLLQPYAGTGIFDYVKDKGFFYDDNDQPVLNESYFVSSKIKLENKREIMNIQKLMQIFIQWHIPMFLVRLIIRLPDNPLFHLIFKLGFIYNKIRTQKIKILPLIRLGLYSHSYMRQRPEKSSRA